MLTTPTLPPIRWFLFHNGALLLTADNALPLAAAPPVPLAEGQPPQPLPVLDGIPCAAGQMEGPLPSAAALHLVPLRQAFDLLTAADFRMAGKAQELLHWDAHTHHCGVCGAPMHRATDISKVCTACGREVWPSPTTAVIVLIERPSPDGRREDDEVLLVQSHNFRGDYYGLVAGFVETGETLEDVARREILEETGLHVQRLRYFASQPWPFPSVLMVGFFAQYAGGEVRLQTSELRKGGWFKRSALPAIPGAVSLARRMIDAWQEG